MTFARSLALFACAGITGLSMPSAVSAATDQDDDLRRIGRGVYEQHCLECHGEAGRGDGPRSERLGFRPRDLSLAAFKCRCTASGELPTDEDLLRTLEQGLPGTPMKGFGEILTGDESRAVVEYVKSLSPRFDSEAPGECLEIPPPLPPSNNTLVEGENIYRALKCWRCHGLTGRGDGPAAAGLEDDWGERIRVFNFAAFGKFKCGGEDRDLYRTLHTGMNGSPMPSFTDAFLFAREDVVELAALEAAYPADRVADYREWTRDLPTRHALDELDAESRRALIDERTWALIVYLRSLLRR